MIHLRVYNYHYADNYRMSSANEQILRLVMFVDQLNRDQTFSGEAKVIIKARPENEEMEVLVYSRNELLKRYLDDKLVACLQVK